MADAIDVPTGDGSQSHAPAREREQQSGGSSPVLAGQERAGGAEATEKQNSRAVPERRLDIVQ